MKWAARLLALLAFAFLVAAGVTYLLRDAGADSSEPAPPLAVGQTDFVLSGIEPGLHELVVPIANPAKIPRQIVGLGEG